MPLAVASCGGDGGETTVIREQPAETQPAKTTTVTEPGGGGGGGAPAPAPAAQPEPTGSEGTYTVGDFTLTDVQVTEDSVGDFEIRARVTNNGDGADFVDIQGTLFHQGSVVADLEAFEDFAAGQTRTVTLIGTDGYGPWDDIEFTVDAGF